MKKILYSIGTALLMGTMHTVQSITAVYAYNETGLPVSLEVTVHYYQKKVPAASTYGGYTFKSVDETKSMIIPIASSRVTLAESLLTDNITIHKAIITKPSETITLPIGQTCALATGQEAHYDASCAIITINADFTFAITSYTTECSQPAR